jgi:hypothetical protein
LHTPGRWLLRMESDQGAKSKAALCHRHERQQLGIGGLWENIASD